MTDPRLYVTTVGLFLSAVAYALVGRLLGRRRVTGPSQLAHVAFQVWWYGLALVTLSLALRNGLALGGREDLPTHLTLLQLFVFANAVALGGLVTYLLFLFLGRESVLRPVIAFYFLYYVAYTFLLFFSDPDGLIVGPVRTSFTFAGPNADEVVMVLVAVFYIPQLVSAAAYGSLWRKVEGATQKFRVGMVSTSILLWSLSNMVLIVASELRNYDWELGAQILNLLAPLGVLVAYAPPRWVQRWVGVAPLGGPAA